MRGPLIRSILVIPAYFFVNSVFSITDSPYVTTTTATTSKTTKAGTIITTTIITKISPAISQSSIEKTTTVTNIPGVTQPYNTNAQMGFFPWPFRATGWGLAGNRNVGIGDAMLPLYGNDYGMFYGDAQVKYAADANWVDSFGGGYRYVYNCARIFGVYVFADHNEFKNVNANASSFWMVSPGIESMGNIWDFRVNGYIPVSAQTESKGPFFGDQLGLPNATVFQGHSQFGQLYTLNNNVGPGIDGEIGYAFPILHRTPRFYLGGYYFSPKNTGNIRGISGRLEFPLNHYFALTAADTYDNNVNNSFEAGLRVTIGGNTDDQVVNDIARRIVDPIQRNLATLSQGTGAPVTTNTTADGLALERSNIFFFSAGAGTPPAPLLGAALGASDFNPAAGNNNCTAENPCSGTFFTQATINSINSFAPNANFYLNTGAYPLGGQIFLNNGQSIYGRTLDFTSTANGQNQPKLIGSIIVLSNNTLDSFTLFNDHGAFQDGVVDFNANNIFVNNLNVGAFNSDQGFHAGIEVGSGSLTLSNSVINAFNNQNGTPAGNAAAVDSTQLAGSVNLTLRNDVLNSIATGSIVRVAGINYQTTGNFTANVINTIINATIPGPIQAGSFATGINANPTGGSISFFGDHDIINANSSSNVSNNAIGLGLTLSPTADNQNISVSLNNSTINATSTSSTTGASAFGIRAQINYTTSFSNDINLALNNVNFNMSAQSPNGSNAVAAVFASNFNGISGGINSNIFVSENNVITNDTSVVSVSQVNSNQLTSSLSTTNRSTVGNTIMNIRDSVFHDTSTRGSVEGISAAVVGAGTNTLFLTHSFIDATTGGLTGGQTLFGIHLTDTANKSQLFSALSLVLANGSTVNSVNINGTLSNGGPAFATVFDGSGISTVDSIENQLREILS